MPTYPTVTNQCGQYLSDSQDFSDYFGAIWGDVLGKKI